MEFQKGELIGTGGEKEVFGHPEHPDRAIIEFKSTASNLSVRQLKGRYYLTKIMHLLFPDAIPDIHLAARAKQDYLITQRVVHDADHEAVQKVDILARMKQRLPPDAIAKADQALARMKKNPKIVALQKKLEATGVTIDPNAFNYTTTPAGKIVYLDNSFVPWYITKSKAGLIFDTAKLKQLINKLPENPQAQALNCLNRLLQLFEEEKGAWQAKNIGQNKAK